MNRVTYIDHSGFLLELNDVYLLFDYYKGDIPIKDKRKEIIVFISHKHQDHYNPKIFELAEQYTNIKYVIPKGTPINKFVNHYKELITPIDLYSKIVLVKHNAIYELEMSNNRLLRIETLKSTDCGVAFLISYQGKTYYHAGDLNLWLWEEETEQDNAIMREKYFRQIDKLKNKKIDLAFVPLDPRQGKYMYDGLLSFINLTECKSIFPMHMWNSYDVIRMFLESYPQYDKLIRCIQREGQVFEE